MGSMSDVMKRVRDDASPEETPADPITTATPGATGGLTTSADVESPSQFSPGEAATPAVEPAMEPAGEPVSEQVVKWGAGRIDPAVVAFHDRYSSVSEQFRAIRARLLSMNGSSAHRVIAITSSVPQEGKSVSTVNLGLVMAEGGEHRTLIADADFRRSSIGRMLSLETRPGLAELIRGEKSLEELLCPTPFPNLKVLPPGKLGTHSASELLGSPTAREVLARLRAMFDYTFLDSPPVNTVSDVSTLAPSCDGAILVVEMHRTPEPTAQQAVRTLQANNVKVLGCILTRHDDRRAHYYDRYSNYYYGDA